MIMNISEYLKQGDQFVSPAEPLLQYSGRMSETEDGVKEMMFPCSYVKFHFKGTGAAIILGSKRNYWDVYAGLIVDGIQSSVKLSPDGVQRIEIGHNMVDIDHVVTFFKRQDACNLFTFYGITLDAGAELRECAPKPERKIEVYGDSVSAGEVSEAVMCIAQPDPEGHEGCYSNSWYSYSWIAARKLNAQIHDIAHGGLPLLPGTGWLGGADGLIGLTQIYDKVNYYPDVKNAKNWDFSQYTPHVVIIAVGQNDSHPKDFMKDDYEGEEAKNWRAKYAEFIRLIRAKYPDAYIICQTTLLMHDESWDRAIGEAVKEVNDPKVTQLLYALNGKGTPGHLRIPEAEMMAQELAAYIETLPDVWNEK